jgi:hypothetical protein
MLSCSHLSHGMFDRLALLSRPHMTPIRPCRRIELTILQNSATPHVYCSCL